MYNGVKKFFILNNFLKEIDKVDGSNFFELKKEEIEKAKDWFLQEKNIQL